MNLPHTISLRLCAAAVSVALAAPAAAQERIVPALFDYEHSGGSSDSYALAKSGGVRAMQVLRSDSVGFSSGVITEIALRHSSFHRQSYASVQDLRVSLGYTNHAPGQLPSQFAQIPSGPMQLAFQGNVSLPDTNTNVVPRPWSVVIPLQQPFFYDSAQGNLVFELETTRVSGDLREWKADVHARTTRGSGHQITGRGCGRLWAQVATDTTLVPGGELRVLLELSQFQALQGMAFLGVPAFGFEVDLGPVGAPGCTMNTLPIATQNVALTPATYNATGRAIWPIPNDGALVGLFVDHQVWMAWPGINAANTEMSTALRVFIGSTGATRPARTDMLLGPAGATSGSPPARPAGFILRLTTL